MAQVEFDGSGLLVRRIRGMTLPRWMLFGGRGARRRYRFCPASWAPAVAMRTWVRLKRYTVRLEV